MTLVLVEFSYFDCFPLAFLKLWAVKVLSKFSEILMGGELSSIFRVRPNIAIP